MGARVPTAPLNDARRSSAHFLSFLSKPPLNVFLRKKKDSNPRERFCEPHISPYASKVQFSTLNFSNKNQQEVYFHFTRVIGGVCIMQTSLRCRFFL